MKGQGRVFWAERTACAKALRGGKPEARLQKSWWCRLWPELGIYLEATGGFQTWRATDSDLEFKRPLWHVKRSQKILEGALTG